MSVREKLNNNPAVATIGAVVVLGVCILLVIVQVTGGTAVLEKAYFLDANSGKIFTAKPTSDPIKAPSGPTDGDAKAGFRATIFACGSCEQYAGKTLQQVADAGAEVRFVERTPPTPGGAAQGNWLSEPETIKWVGPRDPRAKEIYDLNLKCDNGNTATECYPE